MTKEIKIYDTMAGKKVIFKPLKAGEVSCYYCGPTVYNYAHIGNFRTVLVFDLLYRVLTACGYKVHMISNYTDIDDKIIREAQEEKKTEKELTDFYIANYEDCLSKLNIVSVEFHPRVSNYIPQISSFIAALMDKGFAYKTDSGDVYFSVGNDPYYGSLSKTKIDDLEAGARIKVGEEKKSPLDFALWKNTADTGIKFDMPIGLGRPGWHTECVVMINSYFKTPLIDIHGGGFDLKFPHHENEMAQDWAYSGKNLADYWMHVGFLEFNGDKMSKSLGNVVLAKDAIKEFGGNAIREFFLTTYYRAPINFTSEAMKTASDEVSKFQRLLNRFEAKQALEDLDYGSDFDMQSYDEFLSQLADDLNVANALTVLEQIDKKANLLLRNPHASDKELGLVYNTYKKMLETLGFAFSKLVVLQEDKDLYGEYLQARKDRDFAKSDALRPVLMEKGLL